MLSEANISNPEILRFVQNDSLSIERLPRCRLAEVEVSV